MVQRLGWITLVSVLVGSGCAKTTTTAAPPESAADLVVPTSEPKAPKSPSTYRSKQEPEPAAQTQPPDDPAPTDEAPRIDWQEAAALAEAAADAVLDPYAPRIITPALPLAWPPTDAKVGYFVYPMEPLQSSVTEYKVQAATHRIVIDLVAGTSITQTLAPAKPIGTMGLGREGTVSDPVHAAEQALFDAADGTQDLQRIRYLLRRYDKWLADHAIIAKDLRQRLPEFASFIAEGS